MRAWRVAVRWSTSSRSATRRKNSSTRKRSGPALRVDEPLAQALGEVLGELLRPAAWDPLGERDKRGHGGALGVVAVEPRLPLDLGEEALTRRQPRYTGLF